jgi:hypothetical protein
MRLRAETHNFNLKGHSMRLPANVTRLLLASVVFGTLITAAIAAERPGAGPVTPKTGVINLLDRDKSRGLYTWLKDSSYDDPRKVFHVENGTLHVSGEGLGYIGTKDEYRDYRLVIEFKWGDRVWGSRKGRARDSGLFLHAVGPDGNFVDAQYHADYPLTSDGKRSAGEYITSVEAQMIEGGVGDLILIQGKERDGRPIPVALTAEVTQGNVWKKGGEKRTFSTTSCVQWAGHDPRWKDVTGFRGKNDLESPLGEWTRLEVVCRGTQVVVRVNGTVVNEATGVRPSFGKILLQCELTELYVRRWEIWPLLSEAPAP